MWFRLLGSIELVVDGITVPLGPPQRRAVLASLLYEPGVAVPTTTITRRVWGDTAPPAAAAALHSHLARIRRTLREVSARTREPVALHRRGGGYVVDVEPARVDLFRFRELTDGAGDPSLDPGDRAAALREALDLWRAVPLTGMDGDWAEQVRQAMEARRLTALVQWARAELSLGNPETVIAELTAAVTDNPLSEALVTVLMQALGTAGRAAEALSCYAAARRRIAEALGTEPGPELRSAHQSLLRGDVPHQTGTGRAATLQVPAQLPADVPNFVGRTWELTVLDGLLSDAPGRDPAVIVAAVSGTPGVGKTTFVLHWAQRVAKEFPDGQLFVDLRGYDAEKAVTADEALAGFVRALGVPGGAVPADVEERAALFRSLVADRRLLVVLDNASDYDQVRPLLPGSGRCLTVVTSRHSLPTLVVRHGARRIELDLLTPAQAVDLLTRLVPEQVAADPVGAGDLAQRCAYLPLALRIAAEYLAEHPDVAVSTLAAELADADQRLDLLEVGGEPRTAVRAVFSWSYDHLRPAAARAFRLLSLMSSDDVDRYAAAALLDADLRDTGRILDELTRAHLVRQTVPGRYGLHDLLKVYGRERAEAEDGTDCSPARHRLVEHYLRLTAAAMDTLIPHERDRRPRIDPPSGPAPDLSVGEFASTWLEANRAALIAATATAAECHRADLVIAFSTVLMRYLDNGAHHHEGVLVHTRAVRAAGDCGDRLAEATARRNLALAYSRIGRLRDAVEEAERAVAIYRADGRPAEHAQTLNSLGSFAYLLGDYTLAYQHLSTAYEVLSGLDGQEAAAAQAVSNLAGVLHRWGRYDESILRARQALDSFEQLGDRAGVARMLGNIGTIFERLGRWDDAEEHYRRCLAEFDAIGGRVFLARVLGSVASVHQRRGNLDEAMATALRAISAARETDDREAEAAALDVLGTAYRSAGDLDTAAVHHGTALDVAMAMRNRVRIAISLIGLADVRCDGGATDEALTHLHAALTIAEDIDDRYLQARALDSMAQAEQMSGATLRAREHWLEALRLYAELGVPEADEVRARLRLAPAHPGGAS